MEFIDPFPSKHQVNSSKCTVNRHGIVEFATVAGVCLHKMSGSGSKASQSAADAFTHRSF
jgi:hypothetical protein